MVVICQLLTTEQFYVTWLLSDSAYVEFTNLDSTTTRYSKFSDDATLESADCSDDAKLENILSVSAILTQN